MAAREYTVAIAGATGVVGGTVRAILEERGFPVGDLRLLASARSAGRRLPFDGAEIEVQELGPGSFDGVDLVFFAAGGSVSQEFVPQAVAAGATVIDKSSMFRQDPGVPLVVPEVNADHLASHTGIIATPNCSTIQMVVALKPLYDAAGIERVVVSTYQAVSGSGQGGIAALAAQAHASGPPASPWSSSSTRTRSPSTCCRTSTASCPPASTKEEQKMVDETVKIFARPGSQGHGHLRARARVRRAQRGGQRPDQAQAERRRGPRASRGGARRRARGRSGTSCSTPCRCPPRARTPSTSAASREDATIAERPRLLGRLRQPAQGRRAQRGADRRGACAPGVCCESVERRVY